jgi:hypothetical protein
MGQSPISKRAKRRFHTLLKPKTMIARRSRSKVELEVCLRLSHMDAILEMYRAALLVCSQMRPHTTSGLRNRKLHS